jgi:ABC-type nitrate/sulfonate/bicarbonate transport system substrate-binding protein
MKSISRTLVASAAAVLVVSAFVLVYCSPRGPAIGTTTIRIAGTPHQDTTLYMWGMQKGLFQKYNINLDVCDTTFNEQIELVAGNGCDLAMATVDELAAKSKNLDVADRRVLYLMPAWLFEGQIFVSRPDLLSLSELRRQTTAEEAVKRFFGQIRGKKIAVPEGSSYDQAIRRLMKAAGIDPADFNFVNAELEAGINGLSDPNVALAAAGIVERPEAERRGYKVALSSVDLNAIVIAGFISSARFYRDHRDAVDNFLRAWFESVDGALAHPQENYAIFSSYLSSRGAKPPSFEEYERALRYTRLSRSPTDVYDSFLKPDSPTYWRKPWNDRLEQLRESGEGDQATTSTADFVADEVVARLTEHDK